MAAVTAGAVLVAIVGHGLLAETGPARRAVTQPPPLGSLLPTDIDGDGVQDLLVVDPSLRMLVAHFGRTSGGFEHRLEVPIGLHVRQAARIGSAHGAAALIVVDPAARALYHVAWTEDRRPRLVASFPVDAAPQNVQSVDIDLDGVLDAIVSDPGMPVLYALRPCADGRVELMHRTLVAPIESLALADIDRDGHPDVVAQDRMGDVSVLLAGPGMHFAPDDAPLCSSSLPEGRTGT